MGAPPGNDNAKGNPGGPGAPEGNQRAVGGAPELNRNAASHGASIPDEMILTRGEHDDFIAEFVESADMPPSEARAAACSLIRFARAARYLTTEVEPADHEGRLRASVRLREAYREYREALTEADVL